MNLYFKASIFYESYGVKSNGDSCKKLEKTDRKWLNIACNLVQTHLIFTKIEVSHLCVSIDNSSQNASYDLLKKSQKLSELEG